MRCLSIERGCFLGICSGLIKLPLHFAHPPPLNTALRIAFGLCCLLQLLSVVIVALNIRVIVIRTEPLEDRRSLKRPGLQVFYGIIKRRLEGLTPCLLYPIAC